MEDGNIDTHPLDGHHTLHTEGNHTEGSHTQAMNGSHSHTETRDTETRDTDHTPLTTDDQEVRHKPPLQRIASLAPALESKPSTFLFLAIFTIFINPLAAIIGIVLAIDADHQYMRGYTEKARWQGQVVKWLCIVGIIISAILIIVLSSIYHS